MLLLVIFLFEIRRSAFFEERRKKFIFIQSPKELYVLDLYVGDQDVIIVLHELVKMLYYVRQGNLCLIYLQFVSQAEYY